MTSIGRVSCYPTLFPAKVASGGTPLGSSRAAVPRSAKGSTRLFLLGVLVTVPLVIHFEETCHLIKSPAIPQSHEDQQQGSLLTQRVEPHPKATDSFDQRIPAGGLIPLRRRSRRRIRNRGTPRTRSGPTTTRWSGRSRLGSSGWQEKGRPVIRASSCSSAVLKRDRLAQVSGLSNDDWRRPWTSLRHPHGMSSN